MHHWTMHTHPRSGRMLALLLLGVLGLACVPRTAWAMCWFTSGSATTVTFNAGTITLTPSTTIGEVLWTSSTASPANPPYLECDGNTSGGIVNTIAASTPVNGDNTLFPTGIPGVSYRLLHPDASTKLALYPNYPTGSGTFSVSTNLQLIYTGPYLPPNNSTLSGQLSQWKVDICNGKMHWDNKRGYECRNGTVAPRPVEFFNINAVIHIQVPTCDIDPDSVNKSVVLPQVNSQQFTGPGSHAGTTAFQLDLTDCPTNLGVFMTLDTGAPFTGASGVIKSTSGAGGVGVQVLDANTNAPVTFGTAFQTGTTSASNYAIHLKARYYQTGASVTPGNVTAVATYTLNYQ